MRAPRAAGGQDAAQLLDLARLALEHGGVRQHRVHGRVCAAREPQRGVRLVGVDGRRRDCADDRGLGIAAERRLEDPGQLGVPIGDVPT